MTTRLDPHSRKQQKRSTLTAQQKRQFSTLARKMIAKNPQTAFCEDVAKSVAEQMGVPVEWGWMPDVAYAVQAAMIRRSYGIKD